MFHDIYDHGYYYDVLVGLNFFINIGVVMDVEKGLI